MKPNSVPAEGLKTKISDQELNELPLGAFRGKISVITSPEKLHEVEGELTQHNVIGFDTETRPSFKKGQLYHVALLQLAVPGKVFLIRTQQTGLSDGLASILETEDIVKAGVAIRDDIKGLQKFRRFEPSGFNDLALTARQAGLEVESVKKLTGLLLGFRISKGAQTSNWEAQVLTEKQIEYAATDAWVCLEIYNKLMTFLR